jgi:hypothetical protein
MFEKFKQELKRGKQQSLDRDPATVTREPMLTAARRLELHRRDLMALLNRNSRAADEQQQIEISERILDGGKIAFDLLAPFMERFPSIQRGYFLAIAEMLRKAFEADLPAGCSLNFTGNWQKKQLPQSAMKRTYLEHFRIATERSADRLQQLIATAYSVDSDDNAQKKLIAQQIDAALNQVLLKGAGIIRMMVRQTFEAAKNEILVSLRGNRKAV